MKNLSWRSGAARWGIQLLFAIFSVPLMVGGFGLLLAIEESPYLGWFVTPIISMPTPLGRLISPLIFFWWYYLASAYAHYRFDKKFVFNYSTYRSSRMWFFVFQLSLFWFFWELDRGLYQLVVEMLGVPLISITLTWWLSELYCRYIAWKKLHATSTTNSAGE